jgi:hypothetical protein
MQRRVSAFLALTIIALIPVLNACGSSNDSAFTLAPESALPGFVSNAPDQVKEAYRFAIANPEILAQFPCFCGCGDMGHMNNLDCYVREVATDGAITFDNHAFG